MDLIVGYAKVTVKNQVTIPMDVCKRFGIKPGDGIVFKLENNRLILEKA